MRSGMMSLLALLRGEPTRAVSMAEWMTVLDLAEQEYILPWTAACLSATGPTEPQLAQRLHEIRRSTQISAFLWTSALKATLAEFQRRQIPVISLKGPWLAERLYGNAALRTCADLDLLVRRSDIDRAESLLSEIGFSPAGRRDDYERPWLRGSTTVELHHDVENPLTLDFHIDEAWRRAQPAEFHGVPAWLLSPEDERLFLCLHGARHRFERFSHILDLVFAFRSWPDGSTHSRRSPNADHLLVLGSRLAAHLDPHLSLADPPSLPPRDRAALHALADQLWQERLLQPAPKLTWSAKQQFFVALETHPWRRSLARIRHLRILLSRLIDTDFAFAARFNLHRTWQVRLLRPLRLLFTAFPLARPTIPDSPANRS